jgi:diphthine-ammonia ligase
MDLIDGRSFFCSWNGGKDSCLALYHAIRNGGEPKSLLTMMAEGGERSRSHGLPKSLLEQQSQRLGIPIVLRSAPWDQYESVFLDALREFKKGGIETGVFGDIDVDANREWVQRMCGETGVEPYHPLWKRARRTLLDEFMDLQFKATVVVIRNDKLSSHFLGSEMDQRTISEMEEAGIDASGELGEYHTVVTDGSIFSSKIVLKIRGRKIQDEYSFLDSWV